MGTTEIANPYLWIAAAGTRALIVPVLRQLGWLPARRRRSLASRIAGAREAYREWSLLRSDFRRRRRR